MICVRWEGANVYYCIVYNISHSIYPFTRQIILIGRAFNVFSNLRKCNTLHVDNFLTTHISPAGCWWGRGSTNYSGGKMRGNEFTMLPDHNSRDLLCRNLLYTIHFSVVSSVGIQSFMEETNCIKGQRFIGMERKSVFPRWLCKIKHVTASVYVIKRVRVLTFAGQSIDHDGVVDKLKKTHV